MHYLGIGRHNAGKRVIAVADDHKVTVTELHTGEILSTHHIEPHKRYWRDQNKEPGRWPSPRNL